MRIRSLHLPESSSGKVNVTPLIDVVMVLIVFYLIVGKLAADQSAQIELPRVGASSSQADKGLVINVVLPEANAPGGDAGPLVIVDGATMPVTMLRDALRSRLPELASGQQRTPVSLRADRRLAYGAIQPVIDACKEAGVTTLKLVTTQQRGEGAR